MSPYHRHANVVYYLILFYFFGVFWGFFLGGVVVLEIIGHTDWSNEHLKNNVSVSNII